MAKTQKKTQISKTRQKQKLSAPRQKSEASGKQEALAQRKKFWKAELDELKQQNFSSIKQAVEAVVDRALDKYQGSLGKAGDMRRFLIETITLSPEIISQLRTSLKIKD